ncbi:MAG: VWA domain-containing protein [Betaproteobacteria bacterium]|nr:VWA domain-containing protein [Betaproteobacteria bacterium]
MDWSSPSLGDRVSCLVQQKFEALLASPLSLAVNLLLVDPLGLGGIHCKARVSPWRSNWVEPFLSLAAKLGPVIELASHADEQSLIGGIDWASSLHQGKAHVEQGILARVKSGLLKIGMADRLNPSVAALIGQALDQRAFACLLLDEALEDEPGAPDLLSCRLAFWIGEINLLQTKLELLEDNDVLGARNELNNISIEPAAFRVLGEAALAFGVDDLRAPQFALRAYRALKALALVMHPASKPMQDEEALLGALIALVYGPRARRLPKTSEEESALEDALQSPQSSTEPDLEAAEPEGESAKAELAKAELAQAKDDRGQEGPSRQASATKENDLSAEGDWEEALPLSFEQVLAMAVGAAQALLPAGLLASGALAATAMARSSSSMGRSGSRSHAGLRGRSLGVREGKPGPRSRLHVLATIRAAVPWQRLRAPVSNEALLQIERSDLRVHRYEQRDQLTTVFVVDASGSAALHRLAEVKGAVELLLAQCYVRRDQVAVIAFRLDQAQLLLPPTRSLTRAKRQLAALPGGGGTPLASALALTSKLITNWRRQGQRIQAIVLSDGKANIDIEGKPGRAKAMHDAQHQAKLLAKLALSGSRLVWVDTAPRPSSEAQSMAQAMRASYMLLPYANAQGLVALAS